MYEALIPTSVFMSKNRQSASFTCLETLSLHPYPQTQVKVLAIIWKRNAKFSQQITDLVFQKDLETILTLLDGSVDRGY